VSAEVGLSHCGCLGTALAYVQAIAAAGADAAKFQDHRGDKCRKFRASTWFPQDATRQAYWQRTNFDDAQWSDIAECCHDHGIEFICSPFSMEAFDKMEPLVDRWKIASSKVNDHELIDACVRTGKPVIVSSGMSTHEEMVATYRLIPREQCTFMSCVSMYPTPPELTPRYWDVPTAIDCDLAISDHSGTIWPSIVAKTVGYTMTEVHVVFSRECFGPDVTSSITTAELRQLVDGVRFISKMSSDCLDKDSITAELKEMREVFGVK